MEHIGDIDVIKTIRDAGVISGRIDTKFTINRESKHDLAKQLQLGIEHLSYRDKITILDYIHDEILYKYKESRKKDSELRDYLHSN